jgi:hypothetical protein
LGFSFEVTKEIQLRNSFRSKNRIKKSSSNVCPTFCSLIAVISRKSKHYFGVRALGLEL